MKDIFEMIGAGIVAILMFAMWSVMTVLPFVVGFYILHWMGVI